MLLDAITNSFLGLLESKDGDKAGQTTTKTSRDGVNNYLEKTWYQQFITNMEFFTIYYSIFQEEFKARNINISNFINPEKNLS